MKREFKVLFIYPSLFMQTALPLGISSLAAALKAKGIKVKIFDTVFYQETGEVDENVERAITHHSVRLLDYESKGMLKKDTDITDDFTKVLTEYKPDLIGLSAIECVFERGIKLARQAKKLMDIPVIAGGVFATLSPEIVIQESSIDIVCIGEGEDILAQLCTYLQEGRDYSDIRGLWVKNKGKVIKNRPMPLKPLDSVIEPDFSAFDPRIFYRPMQGNLFKTIPIEFARGCPYRCTYCAEPSLNRLYRENGEKLYFRRKSISQVLTTIKRSIEKYQPEFFYFASETFLVMNDSDFNEFIEGYKDIKIPFWIQTRIETITYEKIKRLKEVGLFWLSIGIEHGNEKYRREYLKRDMQNSQIKEVIKILDRCGQGASLNSIIGFPFETRELVYDTIMLNRELFKLNNRLRCNISIFTPFRGCQLYDLCVVNGLFEPIPYTNHTNITGGTLLKSKYFTKEELNGLFRAFSLYVHLPDEYLDAIKITEQFTSEGNRIYEELNKLVEGYIK
jgi:radical SAM superfamily enzyme YgiQ (UPF0313 family)